MTPRQLELGLSLRSDVEEALPFEPDPPVAGPPEPPDPRLLPARPQVEAGARRLADRLSLILRRPVRLSVTDNCSTMLSFRRHPEFLAVRVHHMFLEAPEPVVEAVAEYVGRGRKAAGRAVDAFIRAHGPAIRSGPGRRAARARLEPQGMHFDLQQIFARMNAAHFGGTVEARIGWGRPAPERRRRTIRLGVYDHQARVIRIHPALDRPEVPLFFLEYLVFHEMLHQAVPAPEGTKRRVHHGRAFRTRERAFPDFERAVAWEKEHIGLLLGRRRARRGWLAGLLP